MTQASTLHAALTSAARRAASFDTVNDALERIADVGGATGMTTQLVDVIKNALVHMDNGTMFGDRALTGLQLIVEHLQAREKAPTSARGTCSSLRNRDLSDTAPLKLPERITDSSKSRTFGYYFDRLLGIPEVAAKLALVPA